MKSSRKRAIRTAAAGRRKSASNKASSPKRRWSQEVTTVSTFPPPGLYTKDAQTIAKAMASKRVSPKGIGSAIRMVQFYINRAGKNLSAARRRELERAKQLLQARLKKG